MCELKNLQASGLTTLGNALRTAFDLLNLNRLASGIDNYGQVCGFPVKYSSRWSLETLNDLFDDKSNYKTTYLIIDQQNYSVAVHFSSQYPLTRLF